MLAWHKKATQCRDAIALERRNREIRRLARTGVTNKALGQHFGLYANSVGRILEHVSCNQIQVPLAVHL